MKKEEKRDDVLTIMEGMELWINISTGNESIAREIRRKIPCWLEKDNYPALADYLINHAKEIDNTFSSHTSEQLLQFI